MISNSRSSSGAGSRRIPFAPATVTFIFFISIAAAPGCRPSASEAGPEGSLPSPEASGPASQETPRAEAREDPSKGYDQDLARILAAQDAPPKKLETLKAFLRNLKTVEAGAGKPLPVVAKTEHEIGRLEKSLEAEAAGALAKLEEKLKPLMVEPGMDLTAAMALVGDFPADRFKGTPTSSKFEELKARISLCQSAEMEFDLRKSRLAEDPVKNIALLEGYDPAFAATPFFDKVQQLLKENYKKYVERREAKAAVENLAKWEDIAPHAYRILWPDGQDSTEVKDDVLSVGPNKSAYLKADPEMARTAGTCIRLGDDEWIDVEIRFEAQVTAGGGIFFGARGNEGPGGLYNFSWKDLGDLGIDDEDWHPMVIRIEGPLMEITVTGKKSVETDNVRLLAGPFGIRVTGDKAAIKLRKIQVWVMKKDASAESTEEGKGAKKKGSSRKAPKKTGD